ncbi:hypothetical protein BB934_36645 (plasmid) [Microvirga ossetica]|uniref:Uncharacterized protein n=1 Tax=Microvirga ossetica TaxID=1882682 RepID=A0A1B2EUV2_9HYPH|nr:SDR family oxidoreductase [Microvirga ossetica]ANY83761.1 hypothetical protein BB934_36645 [Microvirga ossetica]
MRRMQNFSVVSRYATLAGCVLLMSATFSLVQQPASLTLAAAFALLSLLGIYDMIQAKHAFRPYRFSFARASSRGHLSGITAHSSPIFPALRMPGVGIEPVANGQFNALAPSWVETPRTADITSDPALALPLRAAVPIGCSAQREEIAGPVLFQCSDAASSVTGQVHVGDRAAPVRGMFPTNGRQGLDR